MKKIILIFVIFLLLVSQIAIGIQLKEEKNQEKENLKLYNASNLPSHFSWADINGTDFTTPVVNQIRYPSCEAFAYVAAVETMVQIKVGYPFGCDLSEAHLFFYSNGNPEWGSYPENDTEFLVNYGVPDEACFPYPNDDKKYPKNTSCSNWMNRTVKIRNWSYLPPNNITAIKEALINNGPVPTHLNVYMDFKYYLGGVYVHRWGESKALHLVCIMGYQDDPRIPSGGYWIVKNSWGKEWGDNGWIKVAYGEASIEEMPVLLEGVYGNFPIVYVDDDNTDGPWDGSNTNPYQTITKAIDNAYKGWTIYVKNGTYHENIIINKTINLDGESKENTIIDGNSIGNVIYVQAPDVRISGLTIRNSGKKRLDSGIRTLSLNSNLLVENCIIRENDVGIYLNCMDFESYPESYNTIKNNIITQNDIGIFTIWLHNNEIVDNEITENNLHGIEMEATKFSEIKNNLISKNKENGIYLHGASNDNNIIQNDFENNNIALNLKEVKKIKIKNNNFIKNNNHATFDQSNFNKWNRNYWDNWEKIIPYPIKGKITNYGIPFYNFDWMPLKKPI